MKGVTWVAVFVLIGIAAGALGGWAVYFSTQPVFQSQTRIGVLGKDAWPSAQVAQLLQKAFTEANLVEIVRKEHLYENERRTMTMTDIVEQMRRDIEIDPRMASVGTVTSFTLGFQHRSPRTAMRVTEQLASRIVFVYVDHDEMLGDEAWPRPDWLGPPPPAPPSQKIQGVHITEGARLPVEPVSPRLLPHLAFGALAGLTVGLAFSRHALLKDRARARMPK